MKKNIGHKGFSLLEIIVYTAIASIIILVLTATLIQIYKIYSQSRSYRYISENGNIAIQRLTELIISASSIDEANSDFIHQPNSLTLNYADATQKRIFVANNGHGVNTLYLISSDLALFLPTEKPKKANVAYAAPKTPTPSPSTTISNSPSLTPTLSPSSSPSTPSPSGSSLPQDTNLAITSDQVNVTDFTLNYSPRNGDIPAGLRISITLANRSSKYNLQETFITSVSLRIY